jgi:hypothetical protein
LHDNVSDSAQVLGTRSNEPPVLTGNRLVTQHNILLVGASLDATASALRGVSARMSNPLLAFTAANGAPADVAPLGQALPPQLALVSMQLLPPGLNLSGIFTPPTADRGGSTLKAAAPPPASAGVLLIRLRHIYQLGLDAQSDTNPATVDLAKVFAPRWKVLAVNEMVVDASEGAAVAEQKRVKWNGASLGGAASPRTAAESSEARGSGSATGSTSVTLKPMELKTYVLELSA